MEKYLEIALKEARKAYKMNEVPVGAVIVKNGKIISKAHNLKEKHNCALAHAEIIAIKKASKKLKNWHLDNCVMYVTLEPCKMCCGAIEQSRISKVYYATSSPISGYVESNVSRETSDQINGNVSRETYINLHNDESSKLLKMFFESKRK